MEYLHLQQKIHLQNTMLVYRSIEHLPTHFFSRTLAPFSQRLKYCKISGDHPIHLPSFTSVFVKPNQKDCWIDDGKPCFFYSCKTLFFLLTSVFVCSIVLETKTQIKNRSQKPPLILFLSKPFPIPFPPKRKQYEFSVQSMIVQDQDHFFGCFPQVEKACEPAIPLYMRATVVPMNHVLSRGDQLNRTKK